MTKAQTVFLVQGWTGAGFWITFSVHATKEGALKAIERYNKISDRQFMVDEFPLKD